MTIQTRVETVISSKDAGATATLKKVEAGALAAKKANDLLSNALKGAVAFFAARFTIGAVKNIVNLADATSKLARTVGTSTEEISRLRYVFDSVGLGANKLEGVLNSFEKKRAMALRGLGEAVQGFALLGISIQDLQELGTEDLFEKIARNLEQVGDQTERQARLSVAFEDSFRGMEEVLGKGSKRFRELRDEAQKFGLIISKKDGIAGEQFAAAMQKLEGAFERTFGRLLIDYLPSIITLMDQFVAGVRILEELLGKVETVSLSSLLAQEAQLSEMIRATGSGVKGGRGSNAEEPDNLSPSERDTRLSRLGAEYEKVTAAITAAMVAQGKFNKSVDELPPLDKNKPAGPRRGPLTGGSDRAPIDPGPAYQPGFIDGLTQSWRNLVETMGTANAVGQQFGNLVGGAISGVSDILVDMIATGKSSSEMWKKLGASVASELAKIAIQYAIIGALKGAANVQFAHGGVGGGGGHDEPARIHKFAHGGMAGGIAGGRSIAVYGEGSRREAFVPLQDGRNIPVRIEGSGGSSVMSVYYISAIDTQSMANALQRHGAIYRGAMRDGLSGNGGDRRIAKRAVR